jgi:hypothetical protein
MEKLNLILIAMVRGYVQAKEFDKQLGLVTKNMKQI